MRHTVSIVYEINQKVILFDRRQPCRRNLLRLKCKLNLWLQSKQIYTPLLWPLGRLSYKPPHLKQHHCNNSWEFKFYSKWALSIYRSPLHIKIDCWFFKLVINGTCVRAFTWTWVVSKMNYFDYPFSQNFFSYKQSGENAVFENKKKVYKWFIPKPCLHYIYLD